MCDFHQGGKRTDPDIQRRWLDNFSSFFGIDTDRPANQQLYKSTTSFTNVAGGNTIQFSVAASTNYTMECHLYYKAASGGGLNIQFTGPASPTNVAYSLLVYDNYTTGTNIVNLSGFGNALGNGNEDRSAQHPL